MLEFSRRWTPNLGARLLGACLLLTAAHQTSAELPLPERFAAEYVLRAAGVVIGVAHWSLTPAGEDRYVFEIRSNTAGIAALLHDDERIERSEWQYHGLRARPLTYEFSRTGRKNRNVAVDFDWDKGIASNTVKGQTWQMPLPPGTLDKLLYQLAVMQDLRDGQRAVEYPIADGGKLKTYRLEVIGEERLETAIGTFDTIKVRRIRESQERETTLWYAPALRFLPVQFQQKEPDGTITARITSLEGFNAEGLAATRP